MRLKRNSSWLLMLIFGLVLVTTGCTETRAKNKLNKATQKVADIKQNYDGLKYEDAAIKAIEQSIDQANQSLAADASQALSLAQSADAQADQVLERVKSAHGNALFTQSEQEIAVARLNNLPRSDAERFNKIGEIKGLADAARSANKWEEVIKQARSVIEEVRVGIEPLKNDADRKRTDADQRLTELNREGGRIYAPEVVIAVEDDIERAKKVSDVDRDYILAANKFQEARNKADQGINQVLREKAREGLERIEGFLTSSVVEGVKQFKPEGYEKITKVYDDLVREYDAGNYSRVITGATNIEPEAQALVVDTKRAASDDRIDQMQKNIRDLDQGGILEYIPNSLEALRQSLASATEIRKLDDEKSFDQIKQISIEASDEYDRLRAKFEGLANDRIREARNSVDKSRAVFEKMDSIFEPVSGVLDSDQQAFENQKQSRKAQLGKQLEACSDNLGAAELRKNQGNYRGSIVLAGEVYQLSESTLSEIYHTVAHNASIELAKLISRYERDGARVYAPEELARATGKLEQVKGSVAQRAYQKAVEQSAEARAEVELLAQRIAGRATEDLRESRAALEAATTENTRRFRAAELDKAAKLIEEASVDLQGDRLKLALEKAAAASATAKTAEMESNRLSADENMAKATKALDEAQQSGAGVNAGRDVEDARRLLGSAKSLYANQDYARADELARSSVKSSNDALYSKINRAEEEIATATAVGGWENNKSSLASANDKVRQARQKLEAKEYGSSASLADSASSQARAVAKSSKRKNFNSRVSGIKENLNEGTEQGINFFQTDESINARREVAALRNEYSSDDYERVMAEIGKLESDLRETLEKTPEVVEEAADGLEGRLDKLVEDGSESFAASEIKDARDSVRFARLDYRRGNYRGAHANLTKAARLTKLTEFRRDHTAYSAEVEKLFAEYKALQLQFANVLTLDPKELKELAVGTNGAAQSASISSQINPNHFREKLDELYSRAQLLKAPVGMDRVHEIVVASFAEGRLAATYFERLSILNRMAVDDAHGTIDQAYYRINLSNQMVADVQRQLNYDQTRFRLARIGQSALVNSIE